MQFHLGRLFDHVHLRVRDLEASRDFYRTLLKALGRDLGREAPGFFSADELFVTAAGDEPVSRIHLAFQARDAEQVRAVYDAMLAAGARDNGPPGERRYHPGYYAAYVLDPDDNNVEAVFHGPAARSAESIVIEA